jgi:hypothetical protein
MTFLAPTALVAGLLLAIPVIVHLFKPRKMKPTPFSSLRWLRQTHQRMSRRIQWHQWLLFLMRAGVLALLVLALAKPLIGSRASGRPTDRFLIIDASRTMAYQPLAQPSPLEQARELVVLRSQRTRAGDRTALLAADSHSRVLAPLQPDVSSHLGDLQSLQPGLGDSNVTSALESVRSQLVGADAERAVELVFVTDLASGAWRQSAIYSFMREVGRPVRVEVVDVGPGAATNAWIAGAYHLLLGDQHILRVEVGNAGDVGAQRTLRLSGLDGVGEEKQTVALVPGKLARAEFRLPPGAEVAGQVAEFRLDPTDALGSDDVWYLPLGAGQANKVLLIEADALAGDGRTVGVFLRSGLEALDDTEKRTLDIQSRSASKVTVDEVRQADLILLAGVAELTDSVLAAVETRVRGGAGLVVFLGPNLKAPFYNDRMHRPLQPEEGLLPFALADGSGSNVEASTLTSLRWQHPLLAPLEDGERFDLPKAIFQRHATFAGPPGAKDQVLARFEDGVPALVEHPLGAGRVLLINTSANDEWSDLPRCKAFVPLLDRMLEYLLVLTGRAQRVAGESLELPLDGWSVEHPIKVLDPRGEPRNATVSLVRGQPWLHIDEITQAGVYRIVQSEPRERSLHLAVNASRTGSRPQPISPNALRQWWQPADFELIAADAARARWRGDSGSLTLWPWLILLAGVLLVIETAYGYWLCPRLNPVVASSVIHQRGLFRPKQEKA